VQQPTAAGWRGFAPIVRATACVEQEFGRVVRASVAVVCNTAVILLKTVDVCAPSDGFFVLSVLSYIATTAV
jgi:hypothetical protein